VSGANSIVVPAYAGTHNHRRLLGRKVVNQRAKTKGCGVWVPAQGRDDG